MIFNEADNSLIGPEFLRREWLSQIHALGREHHNRFRIHIRSAIDNGGNEDEHIYTYIHSFIHINIHILTCIHTY